MRLDKATGTSQGEGPLNQDHRKLEKVGEKGRYSGESGSQESWLGSSSPLEDGSGVDVNLQRGRKLGPQGKCQGASRFSPTP